MSLVDTLIQPLRQKYAGSLDKNERRASRYGAYDLFREQTKDATGILTPDVRKTIKESFGNVVQIPVLNDADDADITISNQRSCTIPLFENTSKLVTLSFTTYAFGFTMFPAMYKTNQIGYERDFQVKMERYLRKLAAQFDTLCINRLNIDRNQKWDGLTATYAQVANALQVPKSGQLDYYNQLQSMFELMDFYGDVDVLANTMHQPFLRRTRAQGAGNDENENFQFNPYDWKFTNRMPVAAGMESTVYAVGKGQCAFENRNDWDSIMGSSVGNGLKKWDQVQVPIVDLLMGSYYIEDCADATVTIAGPASPGMTATKMEGFAFSTDVVAITSYNKDRANNFGPIIKAEFANA